MKVVGNIIKTVVAYTVIGAGLTIGVKAGEIVMENGLSEKITAASKKLFRK